MPTSISLVGRFQCTRYQNVSQFTTNCLDSVLHNANEKRKIIPKKPQKFYNTKEIMQYKWTRLNIAMFDIPYLLEMKLKRSRQWILISISFWRTRYNELSPPPPLKFIFRQRVGLMYLQIKYQSYLSDLDFYIHFKNGF